MTGTRQFDIVVVGGGLVGHAVAVGVARTGLSTFHLAPKGPMDRRTSALMKPSVDFLQNSYLIKEPAALGHPLTAIRIIDGTKRLFRAPEMLFESAEIGLHAFGWNFANARLIEAFAEEAANCPTLEQFEGTLEAMEGNGTGQRLTLSDGKTVMARLVVGADGKKSTVRSAVGITTREHVFRQSALVCNLKLARPLGGTSVEFHYPQGPFTLVPAGETHANLVWIDDLAVLETTKRGNTEALISAFMERSQRLFGQIEMTSHAHIFPLGTLSVAKAGKSGVALVGEAAHAFPPIGAQGLNLGLRDAAELVACISGADRGTSNWLAEVGATYAQRRQADLGRTGAVVDALFNSLLIDILPAQALRAGGLWALKLLPTLRRKAFDVGMGGR